MALAAILVLGLALCVLGIAAYLGTESESVTALIPAFFGVLFATLGLLSRDPRRRKLGMNLAVGLALLGFLGSARGIPSVFALAVGGEVARPAAAVAQSAMAVLCGAFLILAIRFFIVARRARAA